MQPAEVGGWGSCLSNVCIIRRSQFAADTYADGSYGQGAKVIGKYRIQLHDNLNGRSTRQTTKFSNNGGPEVEALHITTDCREDVPLWTDNHCGWKDPVWNKFVYPNQTFTSAEVQGNRLNSDARYYTQVYGDFQSSGYTGTFPIPNFTAAGFLCPHNKNCYFT